MFNERWLKSEAAREPRLIGVTNVAHGRFGRSAGGSPSVPLRPLAEAGGDHEGRSVLPDSDGVAIEELGDSARDGLRALGLQRVTDALHGQVLDLREPRAQQGRAVDESCSLSAPSTDRTGCETAAASSGANSQALSAGRWTPQKVSASLIACATLPET
jgi:hypothetical protein